MEKPNNEMKRAALAVVYGALGAVAGYFVFSWLASQGYYGLVVPGVAVGLGAGFGRSRKLWVGAICGIIALAAGIFSEWKVFPFIADGSFGYFVTHLQNLTPLTMISIPAGALLAFWMACRR